MAHVDQFLTLVQQYFDSPDDGTRTELRALWDRCRGCSFVLTRGKHKGEACGKPSTSICCKNHTKPIFSSTCTVVLGSGRVCGRPCEGSRCSFHPVKTQKPLVVRPWKTGTYLVKGTNVVFCMYTKTVLGYKVGTTIVHEENDAVRSVCETYRLDGPLQRSVPPH